MKKFLLLLSLAWMAMCSSAVLANEASQDANIRGAACVVSDNQGRVLITLDILNNRLAIPGGYVDSDSPQTAAIRETWEETGIKVQAVKELIRYDRAVLYDCRALSPIPIHNTEDGSAIVAAWHAPHFGREVRSVFLVTPDEAVFQDSRFPEQMRQLPELLKENTPSATLEFDNFASLTSGFYAWNASLNTKFQNLVQRLPALVGKALAASSALGSGALFFLLLPFAMATGGLKRAGQLLFVTVVVTVVVGFGKLEFAVPRPFYVFPDLQLASASGYSFPSGHTATAFAVWGLIYLWLKQAGKSHLAIWLLPALIVAASRVYVGVHYVTDVLAGAVVGTLAVAASQALGRSRLGLSSAKLWALLGLATLPLAATQVQPVFIYCSAFSLVFAAMLRAVTLREAATSALGFKGFTYTVMALAVVSAGMLAVNYFSRSSIEILAANTLGMSLLAVCLVGITRFSQSR